jgi:hypothetical protein
MFNHPYGEIAGRGCVSEIAADPHFQCQCQCRDCQRATGTGHADALEFPESAVAPVGTLSFYEVIGDSGKTVSRGFCPKCGSPVLWKFAVNPGVAIITAGSLDNPGVFKPQAVLYASQEHARDHSNPELPRFDKLPPRYEKPSSGTDGTS